MRQNIKYIPLILLGLLLLGLWGQFAHNQARFFGEFSAVLYEVLTLFAFEGEWTQIDDLPWQLHVTRVLAPLATIAGVLFVITQEMWNEFVNLFVRLRSDHLVVLGLGDKAWQFIQSCDGGGVVVVEINPDNPRIAQARSRNVNVFVANALDEGIFDLVNLQKASNLVTLTGDDGTNVELAINARTYLRECADSDHRLRIHMHLDDPQVSLRLEKYPKFFDDTEFAEISFFSVYDLNARRLFKEHPPEIYADVFAQSGIHIMVFAFDLYAEHILLEATRICQFANQPPLSFTLFCSSPENVERSLLENYPALAEICKLNFLPLGSDQMSVNLGVLDDVPDETLSTVTYHVVCGRTDGRALQAALVLRSSLLDRPACNAPIMVQMKRSRGLSQLLESEPGMPEIPDGIYPFGRFDEVLHRDNVIGDQMDELARAHHENWRQGLSGSELQHPAAQDWSRLPEPVRKRNIQQADHIDAKLRAVRCSLGDLPRKSVPTLAFTDAETELLAPMEHERWRVNKLHEGYKAGPRRVESARINPIAVPWAALDDDRKQENIDYFKSYPGLLARALGRRIRRDFVVGVTGHRPHKLDVNNPALRASITRCLSGLVSAHPSHRFFVLSPLAEGADRMLAQIAMVEFGMDLIVALPLPYDLYKDDFESEASINEFKTMVGLAHRYYELPMKFGNQEMLADQGNTEPRNKQYALVGAHVCERADALIGIWDGNPAGGVGGTAEVIEWRRCGRVPAPFANNATFLQRPVLTDPIIISPNPD